jgi:hypothetical protein
MDPDTIQKIATELAKHLPSDWWARYGWAVLLAQVCLTVAAAAAGAFYGGYLKTRGQNLATKHDWEMLQDQLRTNTQLVETIKAEVGQRDWARREWANLRRIKLEELFQKLHDCREYLHEYWHELLEGNILYHERNPIDEVNTIIILYFPELKNEYNAFQKAHLEQARAMHDYRAQLLKAGSDRAAQQDAMIKFGEGSGLRNEAFGDSVAQVETAGRNLLTQIMGVEE